MTYQDLYRRLHDEPFSPFRLRFSNATAIDVHQPKPAIVGESNAVLPVEMLEDDRGVRIARNWKTISINDIVELVDLDGKSNDKKKRS